MIDKRENLGEEGMNSSEQSWKPRKKKKQFIFTKRRKCEQTNEEKKKVQ